MFPSDEDVIMVGELQRQVMSSLGDTWQSRKVVLSSSKLMIGRPGSANVIDYIPLDEILDVVQSKQPADEIKVESLKQNPSTRGSLRRASTFKMEDEDGESGIFVIITAPGGHNSGRSTVFLASSLEESMRWITAIQQGTKTYVRMKTRQSETRFQRVQRKTKEVFSSLPLQIFFSLVILASFITAIISAETKVDPNSPTGKFFNGLETTYLVIFTVELCMNLLSNWFWPFVKDGWNDLDFVVVVITLLSEVVQSLPAINSLRLIRIFKMIRIFRMLNSFRVLINALSRSVIPVINAFCILLLVAAIFAIMATDFFGDLNEEFFGSFFKSLFTLFQMATGDSWASAVTRSLYTENHRRNAWVGIFFVCYMLIVNVVLMNIVVAVLLDEFISTVEREKNKKREEEERKNLGMITMAQSEGPLDPLVRSLMDFSTIEELSVNIFHLYQKLKLSPPVALTEDEFDYLTDSRRLLNADGELGADEFEEMIIREMSNYAHRKISTSIRCERDEFNYEMLFTMKSLLFHIEKINNPIFKQKKEMARKSKKEILRKLFNTPLLNTFSRWKEHVQVTVHDKVPRVIDPEWMQRQFDRLELLLTSSPAAQAQDGNDKGTWVEARLEGMSAAVQEVQETVRTSLARQEEDMKVLREQLETVLKVVERKTRRRSSDRFHHRAAASKEGTARRGQEEMVASPLPSSPLPTSTSPVVRSSQQVFSSCDNVMVNPSSSSIIPFRSSSRSPLRDLEAGDQWKRGINPSSNERRRRGGGEDVSRGGGSEYVRISWFALPNLFDSVSSGQHGKSFKSIMLLLCDDYHLFLRVREGVAGEHLAVDMPEDSNLDALAYAWKLDEQIERILSDNPDLKIDPALYVDVSGQDTEFRRYFQATIAQSSLAGGYVDGTYVNGALRVETSGGSRTIQVDRKLHRAVCKMRALKITREQN
ncbi:hypothetical protein GUITHDRAFT_112542 [Guillardia theta CCMP2712]|uniref:PH domain-containing protein n=1 Tax=Guillardia theta (strain CCMP2712) TaxID=905079 RepID=L1IYN2_GUITC|nr:hypothetical protein GUITHDRAFT_112542 [Guillardia theta CCMP2712]EKX41331.1 hypothetical protein GUITHDRAFT_112542 [Guillardia theta CCMP2712]|eukprot:XP_005828311.1 hypothetical protein GUITHDRAFT_112542 [Guillardia theta CCMP2712]